MTEQDFEKIERMVERYGAERIAIYVHKDFDKSKFGDINCYGIYCTEIVPENEIWFHVKGNDNPDYKFYTGCKAMPMKNNWKLVSNIKA